MLNEIKSCDLKCNTFDVYDYDGLSMQELLCQFFTRLNEVITTTNEVKNLVDYLVGEGLKLEVAEKLNTWLLDGTLAGIINETLFKY